MVNSCLRVSSRLLTTVKDADDGKIFTSGPPVGPATILATSAVGVPPDMSIFSPLTCSLVTVDINEKIETQDDATNGVDDPDSSVRTSLCPDSISSTSRSSLPNCVVSYSMT